MSKSSPKTVKVAKFRSQYLKFLENTFDSAYRHIMQ